MNDDADAILDVQEEVLVATRAIIANASEVPTIEAEAPTHPKLEL